MISLSWRVRSLMSTRDRRMLARLEAWLAKNIPPVPVWIRANLFSGTFSSMIS